MEKSNPIAVNKQLKTEIVVIAKPIQFLESVSFAIIKHSNPKTTELYIRGQEDVNRERGLEIMSKITLK